MRIEEPPHQKIRFRRGDIANLDRLPSAVPVARKSLVGALCRRSGRIALGAALAVVAIVSLGYAAIVSGIGDERLRMEAQAALAALAGSEFDTRIGGVQMSLDGMRMLSLDVSDASIASSGSGDEIMRVGFVRFGLRFLPLAGGEIKLGDVRLGDARIELAAMPFRSGSRLPFLDEAGLVDPDAALATLFDGARRLFAALDGRDVDRIELENIEIVLPVEVGGARVLRLASGALERDAAQALALTARIELGDRVATITGTAARAAGTGAVETVALEFDAPAEAEGTAIGNHRIGTVRVALAGVQGEGGERVTLSAEVGEATVATGRDVVPVGAVLRATAQSGTGKVEIDRLRVASGRSAWDFHGAIGRSPVSSGPEAEPSYRFELVSDGSTVAPEGVPEPTLFVGARVAGRLDAGARLLKMDEIGVRSDEGEVRGEGVVRFEPGAVPGVALSLDVTNLPVGHVKQLWPWFAARSAREWAAANVYGGRIETGRLELDLAPGRIREGIKLEAEEVSGRFTVRGTRFDIAGSIPPVRDGNGTIAFRGTDVDLTLDSGTVFLSGQRLVSASGGEMTIRDAHVAPVIGNLRLDVAGTAASLLELARHEPVDVGRYVDVSPDDLSGQVKGVVTAQIPLQRGISPDSLAWRVDLAYEGLALAKPFQGQAISAATGSISIDPERAVVSAKANLNGMPATIELVEPLKRGDPALRQRRIAMQMDDKARRALAPGLDKLLTGTTEVELDEAARESRAIKAKLDRATLSIPWVGWSKGSGVPANVSFAFATRGGRIELSDFKLNGDTFGATGALSLAGGELVSARFPSARLNRSDDFSLDVKSEGRSYAITVRGKSIDARSVIKLYAKGAAAGGGSGGANGPQVKVNLAVETMTGFHNEVLRDVKLVYTGNGSRTDLLQFSASTGSGKPVRLRDSREGNERAIAISSGDAGAVLRFLDIYDRMQGGEIKLALNGSGNQPLTGSVDARDFWLVDEPRLRSIVSTPATDDGRSLNQALRGRMDTQRVHFERGYSRIVKDDRFLSLDRGILRGPLIGASFQGVLYDQQDNMAMTGTFMPAYGFNRLFGEIPLIGRILGNGRDRGLIGITFRLAGKAGEPQLQVNPLSVIAPGIFRSVFEFR